MLEWLSGLPFYSPLISPAIVENYAEFARYYRVQDRWLKMETKVMRIGESADTISEECSSAQQPEGVENNENGRPCIGQDREPETRVAEQGEDEKDSLYPDGESDVKSNYT